MRKKVLPGNDAAIFALLAEWTVCGLNDQTLVDILIDDLSCPLARKIALAVVSKDITNPEAKLLLDWANSLDGNRSLPNK
jgi:hypothetical protein